MSQASKRKYPSLKGLSAVNGIEIEARKQAPLNCGIQAWFGQPGSWSAEQGLLSDVM